MISICIPVFNRDIAALIAKLSPRLLEAGAQVELIVAEDGSTDAALLAENEKAVRRVGGLFLHFPENMGRFAIRKKLAENASFPFLVFIDADCIPANNDFLSVYLDNLPADVVCGGLLYEAMPADTSLLLHWNYGISREVPAARQSLLTSNFCIRKELLLAMPSPQLPRAYGHEDTWMEAWLTARGAAFRFIDNPVYHLGLKDSAVFLEQQEQAVENLLFLAGSDPSTHSFLKKKSSLLKMLSLLELLRLRFICVFFYRKKVVAWREKIISGKKSLRWLDVYKLCYAALLRGQGRY